MSNFDVFSLKSKPTVVVDIEHPSTGESTGFKITMHSRDSKEWRNKELERTREYLDKQVSRKGRVKDKVDPKIILREKEDIAEMFISWEGTEQPCTPENAKNLMTNPEYNWMSEQVIEAFNDRENF